MRLVKHLEKKAIFVQTTKNLLMNVIEDIRKAVVCDLFATGTVNACWSRWGLQLRHHMGASPTAQSILNVGEHLSDIFKSTGTSGREQSELSGGGTGWEALVAWYFNLCTVGSRVVAIKKTGSLPTPIRDAITVNYSNFACSSESDITVLVFPDNPQFTSFNRWLYNNKGKIDKSALDALVAYHFADFEVGIIQCKTNWNDNAQIPMLWDMIYSAGGFRGRQISVGKNNFSIQQLNVFTYSFVTVPTNNLSGYKTSSTPVGRVKNLSGGNYWGYPTVNGIARNVKEIFQNYQSGFVDNNIRTTLTQSIPYLTSTLLYFKV